MSAQQNATIVAAARACIGVRFRPQGRAIATGLDCVGLASTALRAGGVTGAIPADYALRGDHLARLEAGLRAAGLARADQPVSGMLPPGALLVVKPGPMQVHLGIWTGSGMVHADAAKGRVVEWPGDPPWPVLSVWQAAPPVLP